MTRTHHVFAPTALAVAISLSAAQLHAADLPTGGNIVGGSGSISQDGNSLNVQQNSNKLITDWNSFDIGAGNTVNFYQPGKDSVALNRVIGEDASAIYGNLNANGKVFLINPNGVLFGKGAAVNVGALVASTLSLSNEDFNDGNYQFQGDGNNAAVTNHGTINADQGAVALLGGQVSNHGIIQANQGTVALAAGDKITLDFAGDGLLNVTVDEGTIDALVENHQLIRANGGQVVMTANATNALLQTVVNNTGIIEAQTLENQSGTIVLKGGFNGGTVNVAGTLDASALDSGDGGFIDTSGANVKVAGGTHVTTKANNGTTGEWLIDPTDFTISAGSEALSESGIGADTLSDSLSRNNVTLETPDAGSDAGDLYVNGAVSWDADTTLSLDAHNDIHINETITGTNGGLTLNAGGEISASGAVNVGTFNLQSGAWSQLGATLADFSARDFRFNTANASFLRATSGDGSEGNAYRIFDIYGLQGMASRSLLSRDFTLTSTLDAGGTANWNGGAGFVPIGEWNTRYTGDFDGGGHIIYGLTINRAATNYVGLFGVVDGSHIGYIALQNASIIGRAAVGGLVGGGYNGSRISNSSVQGDIVGTSGISGGLVGSMTGTIEHSHSSGTVDSYNLTGGLVGSIEGEISDSYSSSSVEGSNEVGGLAGDMNGQISGSYATGDVRGSSDHVGGLVGRMNGSISDSYATGNVQGTFRVGGLAGRSSGTIRGSYATGSVQGSTYIGGLVGVNTGTVNQSYASGNVSGPNEAIGGLVGTNNGAINYSYASGLVAGGYGRIGGLVGLSNGSILGSYATGDVSGTSREIGGLVGFNATGSISQSYATGQVSGPAGQVGALAGRNTGTLTDNYWNTETSGQASAVGDGSDDGTTGLTTAQMFDAANFLGFDFADIWANADDQTTPYLRALAGNRVFNKNVLPDGTIDATNRPALYTVIQNVEQLQAMRNNLTLNYLLGNHIDASATAGWNGGAGFDPLGASNDRFSGQFDGLGYTVDSLTIQRPEQSGVGLFGYIGEGSSIRNLGLTNVDIRGQSFVGSLVGNSLGVLEGVFATGKLAADFVVGGLAGLSQGSISESYAATDIEAFSIAGGLVGSQGPGIYDSATGTRRTSTIDNSYAAGTINVTVDPASGSAGGLVGVLDGAISNSYSTVIINDAVARLLGSWNGGVLTNVYYANTDRDGNALDAAGFDLGGRSWAEMTQLDTFSTWDSDIDAQGGTGSIWRIYEGYTTPLLRRFLTALNLNGGDTTTTYDGTEQSGSWSASAPYDADRIHGQAIGGRNAGTYNLDMSGLYSDQLGYDLITTDGTLTIERKAITGNITAGDKAYDGTRDAVTGGTLDGVIAGDDIAFDTEGSFADKNAGTDKEVDVSGSLSGTDAGNYELSTNDTTTADIDRKAITGNITADDKTYDGTRDAVTGGTLDGVIAGDDVLFDTDGAFADKNAGDDKQVDVSGSLSGIDAGNYDLSTNDTTTADIDRKAITGNITADDKTYDGTRDAVTGGTLDGVIAGDDIAFDTEGGFADKNAGTDKEVDVSGSLSGGDADNYSLSTNDTTTADIDRKAITGNITAGDKTYDGTRDAVTGGTLDGVIAGDDIAFDTEGSFADKNAGTDKEVDVSGSLSGTDAGNYELSTNDTTTADIDRKAITGNITADDKTYDGTRDAVTGGTLDGVIAGDDVLFDTDGAFADKNAGDDKQVDVSGSLSGIDAGNYDLSTNDTTTADIDRKAITGNITADDKTYDGTRDAVTGGTLDGVIAGDDIQFDTDGAFADKNAGDDKQVDVSGSLSGTDAGNYELSTNDTTTADIDRKAITGNITVGDKTYDGTRDAVTGGTLDGVIAGDDIAFDTEGSFADKNAGDEKQVDVSGSLSGTDAGNYDLSTNDTTTADIDRKAITGNITVGDKTYDGTRDAVTGGMLDGVIAGDDIAFDTEGAFADKNAGTDKEVDVSGSLSGTDAGNYDLSTNDTTTADIDRKAITGNITAGDKTYDGTRDAVTGGTLDGVIAGDDIAFDTEGSFADKNAGGDKQVDVSGSLSGTDAGNYELSTNDTTTADIDRKVITADIRALDKLFDGSLVAILEGVLNGTISGDDVELQLSGLFASLELGENSVSIDASLIGADAGNYELIAPDSVAANLLGFVQSEAYQSAIVSQPPLPRQLNVPGDAGYQLVVDENPLGLADNGQQ